MLEEICVSKVATYPEVVQRLGGLKQINFFFGTNGSGKTTISRILVDAAAYPTCTTVWFSGRTIETLVYNSDFVENEFHGTSERNLYVDFRFEMSCISTWPDPVCYQ